MTRVTGALIDGAVAGAATALTAALCARLEGRPALQPVNAVSHSVWGDEAAEHGEPSLKYTLTGLAVNTLGALFWASIYGAITGRPMARTSIARSIGNALALSGAAYVTDYHLVPRRFTPGFEKPLSPASLLAVFGSLAAGLAARRLFARAR